MTLSTYLSMFRCGINTGMKAAERKQAIELGKKLYYTNVPCKHGHLVARRTATGTCIECERTRQASPTSRAYHRRISATKRYIEQRKKYRASIAGTEQFKEATRAVHLKLKYGLTLEEHKAMYKAQNEQCAICSKHMESHNRQTNNSCHVDHDHTSGKVRALLCGQCNRMLGQANDSIEILRRGIIYLSSFTQQK